MKYYTKPVTTTFADATPTRTEHWIYRPDGTPIALCDDKDEAEAMTKGLNDSKAANKKDQIKEMIAALVVARVPLNQLHQLVTHRAKCANEGSYEGVSRANKMIKQLLGIKN